MRAPHLQGASPRDAEPLPAHAGRGFFPSVGNGEGKSGRDLVDRALEAALELISPTRCACCERPGELICPACREEIQLIDPVRSCLRCGAPFGSVVCTECAGECGGVDRCLAAAVFDGPVGRIVRAYKDAGERRLAGEVARLMLDAAVRAQREAPERYGGLLVRCDAVVFVPATAAAYRRRGFDHMELIARRFCALTDIPLLDALVKYGRSDQRELGRQRRIETARGSYGVVAPVRGKRILLIDDVITTGATMSAAGLALKEEGAGYVDGLAFARVWG